MKTKTYSASETAFLLRQRLGPMRAWTDFLSDCIRIRTNLDGLLLMPINHVDDGRAKRPVYALEDIVAFICEIWKRHPEARKYVPPKGKWIDLEPSGKHELYVKSLVSHLTSPRTA